jgi:hypothetical protein
MNPVWQKLNLGLVSEAMRKAAGLIVEDERIEWEERCWETGADPLIDELPFACSIWSWLGRLVASQKRLINFGDKENKHNRSLLGILGRHGKLALAGRSVDQREEDELMTNWPRYMLEDYGFMVTRLPRENLL